ncbi:hypothetical protein LQ226_04980 [Pontibacillus sp. HN14]|uniref:GNAT family acetyltransferase n=1 Tax=Pontibacillus chungwhensis TaxID=265426 RepID=A0ABY8V4R3_9BACI|nr:MULTISPECIES: hypothetical protein [Pontibacillus]MCD5323092.1 hypothetical protein [Pontibacillus sp. HN14]WIG00198.1 hypothetical protein QNI29_12040 [Pontibacillus chungwhensis]
MCYTGDIRVEVEAVRDFHCCATCVHFTVAKEKGRVKRFCKRLGYETDPRWKFDCWTPKDHVLRLMKKEESKKGI